MVNYSLVDQRLVEGSLHTGSSGRLIGAVFGRSVSQRRVRSSWQRRTFLSAADARGGALVLRVRLE